MTDDSIYNSPLHTRYASPEMSALFSTKTKYQIWRRLWVALARAEKKCGLDISQEQIDELEKHITTIDFSTIQTYEKKCRHEVMAHIWAYGDQCPTAKGIIHLGATSSYVLDNTAIIQMRDGFKILRKKLVLILKQLHRFATAHAGTICLAYTHLQPAQPTTMGKRCCSWIQDILFDLKQVDAAIANFQFLGVKGATGTQASFLSLFNYDHDKVIDLEQMVCEEMDFKSCYTIATQTYPRKLDMHILSILSALGASLHKMANDIRLLTHTKEMSEPFDKNQVGSSAMPYKRNPILSERVCSLARYLISHFENAAYNASLQWLERTLDDSANRRLMLAEAFLCADALCNLIHYIAKGMRVFPKMIEENLKKEIPYLALETILMLAAEKGHDRQVVHEKLRKLATEARIKMLEEGVSADLLQKILDSNDLGLSAKEIERLLDPKNFVGRAEEQTKQFLKKELAPWLRTESTAGDVSLEVEV